MTLPSDILASWERSMDSFASAWYYLREFIMAGRVVRSIIIDSWSTLDIKIHVTQFFSEGTYTDIANALRRSEDVNRKRAIPASDCRVLKKAQV